MAEPFEHPVHSGILGTLPLTFMFTHQTALHWGSIPDAVLRRDACLSASALTTAAWITESEVDTVMSFRDVVFARAEGGDSGRHDALSDAKGTGAFAPTGCSCETPTTKT